MPMSKPERKNPDQPEVYQIGIEGHPGSDWTDWFEYMTVTAGKGNRTLLTGLIADQAALHGILKKIRDLGMTLVSVNRLETE